MFPVFHLSGESRRRMLQAASRFPYVFKARAEDSHKGTFGTLAVVGGSAGMSGAPVLAASAAMYLGCGKVWAGFNQDALPFAVIAGFPRNYVGHGRRFDQASRHKRLDGGLRLGYG